MASHSQTPAPQIQPCRYKTGKTLGAGSYSVVKECVHIDTGRYYAAKVINKKMMAGREHMVCQRMIHMRATGGAPWKIYPPQTMYQKSHKLISLNAQKVRNEIAVLKKVSMGHQNILTLVDYFETMNNRTPAPLPLTHERVQKKVIANPCTPHLFAIDQYTSSRT